MTSTIHDINTTAERIAQQVRQDQNHLQLLHDVTTLAQRLHHDAQHIPTKMLRRIQRTGLGTKPPTDWVRALTTAHDNPTPTRCIHALELVANHLRVAKTPDQAHLTAVIISLLRLVRDPQTFQECQHQLQFTLHLCRAGFLNHQTARAHLVPHVEKARGFARRQYQHYLTNIRPNPQTPVFHTDALGCSTRVTNRLHTALSLKEIDIAARKAGLPQLDNQNLLDSHREATLLRWTTESHALFPESLIYDNPDTHRAHRHTLDDNASTAIYDALIDAARAITFPDDRIPHHLAQAATKIGHAPDLPEAHHIYADALTTATTNPGSIQDSHTLTNAKSNLVLAVSIFDAHRRMKRHPPDDATRLAAVGHTISQLTNTVNRLSDETVPTEKSTAHNPQPIRQILVKLLTLIPPPASANQEQLAQLVHHHQHQLDHTGQP